MKYLLILIVFSFSIIESKAQTNERDWKLTILDRESQLPLSAANINIGQVDFPTSVEGQTHIPYGKLKIGDTILITCLGYAALKIPLVSLEALPAIVELTPVSYNLKEVVIGSNKKNIREVKIGPKGLSLAWQTLRFNSQYAQYINNNEKQKGYIKSVIIHMRDVTNGINQPFKLRLYKKNEHNEFPAEELMSGIVLRNFEKKKWFEVDISYLKIPLPENGIIISFETLTSEYYSDKLIKIRYSYKNELPAISITSMKSSMDKRNYCLYKLDNKKWFANSNIEFQIQLKLITTDD